MRVFAATLLIGAAAATVAPQQVLQKPLQDVQEELHDASKSVVDNLAGSYKDLKHHLSSLTDEARAVWDEVAAMFPESMSKASLFSPPKKHSRKPDSHWDHILKGEDLQKVWIENAKGEMERDVEGKLESYSLRTKKVDPSALGVDPGVTQYSGYLDDDEDDKHLFYCESCCLRA